jgi:hypothetical protein
VFDTCFCRVNGNREKKKSKTFLQDFDPFFKKKDKGKAIPLQLWTGPEGSRKLRLPDFKTLGT